MAEEFDSMASIRREAAQLPRRRIREAAEHAVIFLRDAEEIYKRDTGRDLSPEVAAAFLLRRSRLNLG